MGQKRLACGPEKVPPGDWVSGAVVSFEGQWWLIDQMHRDTQGNSGTHFELVPAVLKPKGVANFAKADDPAWPVGEVVDAPNGKPVRITHVERTTGRVGYYGTDEPPPDPPELTALFR